MTYNEIWKVHFALSVATITLWSIGILESNPWAAIAGTVAWWAAFKTDRALRQANTDNAPA